MINQGKQGTRRSWTPKRLETEGLLQWWLSEIYLRHFNQNCIVGDININFFITKGERTPSALLFLTDLFLV